MINKTITVEVETDEGYNIDVDIDVMDVIAELGDDEIYDIAEMRGVVGDNEEDNTTNFFMLRKLYFNSDDLKRHLCDIVGCGYHEPTDSLLNKLKDMI